MTTTHHPENPQPHAGRDLGQISNELLCELKFAHQIVQNALKVMTIEQKSKWAALNDADGLIEFGTARAHERADVIATAERSLKC